MLYLNKKFFFITNLKHNILNNNYLFFFNNKINSLNYNSLDIKNLQANNLKKLNSNNNNFLARNSKLLMLKNLNHSNLNLKDINFISFSGYLINNTYKNKLINYNLFFSNNFKLFIFMVYTNINKIKILLFWIIFKIIYLINNKIQNKLIKN